MAKRVFISFRFREIGLLNDLLQFFQENGGPVQATPAYMKEDLGHLGEDQIAEKIRQQMTGCRGMLVLAGDTAHSSPWMRWEGGVANEIHLRKFGIRHPNAAGAFSTAHAGMQEMEWSPAALAKLIEEL